MVYPQKGSGQKTLKKSLLLKFIEKINLFDFTIKNRKKFL